MKVNIKSKSRPRFSFCLHFSDLCHYLNLHKLTPMKQYPMKPRVNRLLLIFVFHFHQEAFSHGLCGGLFIYRLVVTRINSQWLCQVTDTSTTRYVHSFFFFYIYIYKNLSYKNIEAEICQILRINFEKNIL